GTRTTVTDANGVYVLRALPPGRYNVTFELQGFQTVAQEATLELGRDTAVNASMALAGVTETITVTAEAIASPVVSTTGGANFTSQEIANLPTGRTLQQVAQLAPGLTTNTPNAGQLTISG